MSANPNVAGSGEKFLIILVMRFLKLLGQILIWIADGKRNLEHVSRLLQLVNDRPDFVSVLDTSRPAFPASVNTDTPADGYAAEWQRFYKQVFGITVDLSSVRIPADPGGFGWVVFVIKELTYNSVCTKCYKLFASSFRHRDLDIAINKEKEEGTAENGPYAARFRNCVEPDEENNDLSANTLAERQTQNITLLEATLMELWYFWRTGGGHLNFVNRVLCAGSRYRGGGTPLVCRDHDKFYVDDIYPSHFAGFIRSRSAVRLPTNPSAL